jgi:hypothetical protein
MKGSKKLIVRDEELFKNHSASTPSWSSFVSFVTLGLIKVYRMHMAEDRIYLVDVGYNNIFIYDAEKAGHREKYFWKLNIPDNPLPLIKSVPKQFDVEVEIPEIPSFDENFGDGGWVTLKYNIRVTLKVTRQKIEIIHRAVNPLSTVQSAVRRAARRVLPFIPYTEAALGTAEQDIEQVLKNDHRVKETGLTVHSIDVGRIEGSKELAEELQGSFSRILKAKDRREVALLFDSMDQDVFLKMLESEDETGKALEMRSRQLDRMLEATMVSGQMSLPDVASLAGQAAVDVQQPVIEQQSNGLAAGLAGKALEQIQEWAAPKIPEDITTHEERMRWEREIIKDRVPTQLMDINESWDTFNFILETGDELKIVWWTSDSPPEVQLNGRDRRSEYVVLSPGVYDYDKVTVWDIYWETRRQLGITGSESSANKSN